MPASTRLVDPPNIEPRGLGSLQAHKSLPRPTIQDGEASNPYGSIDVKIPSTGKKTESAASGTVYTTQERINSWIPPNKEISPAISAPLTPPLNGSDAFKSWMDDSVLKDHTFPVFVNGQLSNTSLRQQSPPTPETTPPKRKSVVSMTANDSASLDNADNRTDSFKTAEEDFDPGIDTIEPSPISQLRYQQKWAHDAKQQKQKTVGLGLGIELDDDQPTPTQVISTQALDSPEFVSFDGAWGGDTPARIHEQLQDRLPKVGATETPLVQESDVWQEYRMDEDETQAWGEQVSPTTQAAQTLKRYNTKTTAALLLEERINDSLGEELMNALATTEGIEAKRGSNASSNSTVIAAKIIDNSPRRRITLRHTGKIIDTSEWEHPPSPQKSLRRTANKPHTDLRRSFSSGGQQPATKTWSTNVNLRVLPDRRSSVWSSGSSSKRHSGSFSSASRTKSSRPTTAPESRENVNEETLAFRGRAQSVIIQQAKPQESGDRSMRAIMPPDMPEASSPSVQTSQLSLKTKAISVTSTDLKTHSKPPMLPTIESGLTLDAEVQEEQGPSSRLSSVNKDTRSHSSLLSPFSLRSTLSASPGVFEIGEATALNIYPHTNSSILVIQEVANQDTNKPAEKSSIVVNNASLHIPSAVGLLSPLRPAGHSSEYIESPLQNPRSAPPPPDIINVIPPTPSHTQSPDPSAATPSKTGKKLARLSSLHRSITLPFHHVLSKQAAPLARRHSTTERSTRLHPFWRPRSSTWGNGNQEEYEKVVTVKTTITQRGGLGRSASLANRITTPLRTASLKRYGPRR
ncbi:uncharacterized protein KY384_001342 [Bacidia gigantensis]|uniref:uncharacterized protein n=1 Tax=Bacidia gigantensis TaxID=2732470 RepID=UPI001D04554D|nr:uncharacterized protein KY384_001342 [Bacidia gigantensis]KAG8533602.1 hypothetical protein KY384_001342 [Bacidia gigantensis]